ncbi:MAG: hotdog fold domain-containing protein [Parashewanella sp.]
MTQLNEVETSQLKRPANKVLKLYHKTLKYPFGKYLFSQMVAYKAPYFSTIRPFLSIVKQDYCECLIKKRWRVQNHIKTVHVIAICNGLEMAMGTMAEVSIPSHLRWIPKGMSVDYVAKAGTNIRCVAEVVDEWQPGDLDVKVTAFDENNVEVVTGTIKLWVSEKPNR